MKQIISFDKELKFNTRVNEICSISLEHNYTKEDDGGINGEFFVSGDYKISDISVNRENFDFKIPFNIDLDRKYNTSNSDLEIDDFYYELVNNESLKVNIDIVVDNIEENEEEREEVISEDEFVITEESDLGVLKENNEKDNTYNNIVDLEDEVFEEENEREIIIMEEDNKNTDTREVQDLFKEIDTAVPVMGSDITTDDLKSIFDNNDSETFTTYHVHIVRETDTLETICTKYSVTKEELSDYNDLNEIIIGNKIIVPVVRNEKDN